MYEKASNAKHRLSCICSTTSGGRFRGLPLGSYGAQGSMSFQLLSHNRSPRVKGVVQVFDIFQRSRAEGKMVTGGLP